MSLEITEIDNFMKMINLTCRTDSKNSSKVLFNIGDRVMAKWSDCRKYPAKVKAILGNGK